MCKYYGYLRVSTSRKNKKKNSKNELVEKQDYERQLYIFKNYREHKQLQRQENKRAL